MMGGLTAGLAVSSSAFGKIASSQERSIAF
ncbi:MAG: hypothetical protein ACI89Z_000245 [Porticoccus sp.]|jgi:hypothetical protein